MLRVNLFLPSVNTNRVFRSTPVSSQKTMSKSISFRSAPWRLSPSEEDVSNYGSISANDAIRLYKRFACGNYLDIGEDKYNFEYCNKIRQGNLEFLDRLTIPSEQRKFIEYYKNLTGFPCLADVSENIKKEFVKAVQKTSEELYYPRYKVLEAGYDGVCSVGRKKALPGSDLDKAYVIIAGSGYSYEDEETVNKFKEGIWKNTDQRILSYNHDEAAFPQVYTLSQLKKLTSAAQKAASRKYGECINIPCSNKYLLQYFNEQISRTIALEKFKEQLNNYTTDYSSANRFYINICKEFPFYSDDGITKEKIKNAGFVLETMREGQKFSQFGKVNSPEITDSIVYKLVNLSQLKALKQQSDSKPKRVARNNIRNDFNSWPTDKQYRFIKTLIKSSCANNRSFTTEFAEYFSKPGEDLFAPLIKDLMS